MPTTTNRLFFMLSLLWTLLLSAQAQAATPIPSPPKMAAGGHLLIDFDSNQVLAENNAEQRLEPASLTKIMTAYTVLRELKAGNIALDEQVLISQKAWRTPGSRMFIEVGKRVSVELLLKGVVIQSGNDASVALAEHVAGSEETFANLMNEHARRLGATMTHFVNSTGLPAKDHYTTPRDIARIAAATIREFPEFYKLYSVKEFTFNKITQRNRNKLLWLDDAIDGMKTGHTEAAGYCLVASAKKDGMRLISVIMGASSENSRVKESQSLLNYGFRFFETHRLYGADESLASTRVWKGSKKRLGLGLQQDLYITIPRRTYENLEADMVIDQQITAPIKPGQVLGKVNISLEGKTIAQVPLVALESVAEGNIWQTIRDSALLLLE